MTREEAIEVLQQDIPCEQDTDLIESLEMAIEALQVQANEINQKDILNALLEGKDEEQRKIIEDAIEKMENLGSKKQAQADGRRKIMLEISKEKFERKFGFKLETGEIKNPKEIGQLIINQHFSISFCEGDKIPSKFHLFMQRILLGWKWEGEKHE